MYTIILSHDCKLTSLNKRRRTICVVRTGLTSRKLLAVLSGPHPFLVKNI